jgi:hypothetical protein
MSIPWFSLTHYQLTPVNKGVTEKEQLEKGLEEEEKIMIFTLHKITMIMRINSQTSIAYISATRGLSPGLLLDSSF